MKFDNLCKLVLTERDEFDELRNAISGTPEDAGTLEVSDETSEAGEHEHTDEPSEIGDEIENDVENEEDIGNKMPESREEQIDYLVDLLPGLSRQNRAKSEEEIHKMANDLIDDGLFETIFTAHEEVLSEPVDEEDIPEEIKTDKPIRGTMGDEPDVPGLTEYEKEQRALDRYREEEEGIGQD